jgi:hypothetical protein
MKLIFVLDHLAQHQCKGPNEDLLRDLGHKLEKLWNRSMESATRHKVDALETLNADQTMMRLIRFLADFAHADGRYANLNMLADPNSLTDPLTAWDEIVSTLFELHATPRQKQTAIRCGSASETTLWPAMNEISDLRNAPLSVGGLHKRVSEIDTANRYAVWYFVRLIEGLRTVLKAVTHDAIGTAQELGHQVSPIPFMDEFFYFACSDRRVLKKKRWP